MILRANFAHARAREIQAKLCLPGTMVIHQTPLEVKLPEITLCDLVTLTFDL